MPEHRWEWFAKQMEEERNPLRIAELTKELNDALLDEEREKVRNRISAATKAEPADPMSEM